MPNDIKTLNPEEVNALYDTYLAKNRFDKWGKHEDKHIAIADLSVAVTAKKSPEGILLINDRRDLYRLVKAAADNQPLHYVLK